MSVRLQAKSRKVDSQIQQLDSQLLRNLKNGPQEISVVVSKNSSQPFNEETVRRSLRRLVDSGKITFDGDFRVSLKK